MGSNQGSGMTDDRVEFAQLDDETLLSIYASMLSNTAELRQEIEERILKRNALGIPDASYDCLLPRRFTYRHSEFAPLKEILSDSELKECWTPPWTEDIPAHTVEHPEEWDTIKALAVARKRGDEPMRVIESARLEGRGSLIFRPKRKGKVSNEDNS